MLDNDGTVFLGWVSRGQEKDTLERRLPCGAMEYIYRYYLVIME